MQAIVDFVLLFENPGERPMEAAAKSAGQGDGDRHFSLDFGSREGGDLEELCTFMQSLSDKNDWLHFLRAAEKAARTKKLLEVTQVWEKKGLSASSM